MTSAVDERRGDEDLELEDRYGKGPGRGRPKRATAIGATLIGVLTLLVIGYWGLAQWQTGPSSSIAANVVSFRSPEPGIAELDLSLTVQPGYEVACAIEVQNRQHLIVGWDVVVIPESDLSTRNVTVQLRTTQPLDTVLVNQCWIP